MTTGVSHGRGHLLTIPTYESSRLDVVVLVVRWWWAAEVRYCTRSVRACACGDVSAAELRGGCARARAQLTGRLCGPPAFGSVFGLFCWGSACACG